MPFAPIQGKPNLFRDSATGEIIDINKEAERVLSEMPESERVVTIKNRYEERKDRLQAIEDYTTAAIAEVERMPFIPEDEFEGLLLATLYHVQRITTKYLQENAAARKKLK